MPPKTRKSQSKNLAIEDTTLETLSKQYQPFLNVSGISLFDGSCIRKLSNWTKAMNEYKFDKPQFDPKLLLKDMPLRSPKLKKLLENISKLDADDMRKHGRLFKHFIFSDIKTDVFGAKIIASGLLANGMTLGYSSKLKKGYIFDESEQEESEESAESTETEETNETPESSISVGGAKDSPWEKIQLLSDEELLKTPGNNFYLLSSVAVYDKPISVQMKKQILKKFNQRPENVYGDFARIIVMDSGFKEGIDLFDVKYIHIFEPQITAADQTQVVGRGTRTCGQKGLVFHPTRGWPLYVYNYDVHINEQVQGIFKDSKNMFELYLKAMNIDIKLINMTTEVERLAIKGSVDYDLNKNIHSFKVSDEEESSVVVGGMMQDNVSNTVFADFPEHVTHENMREYIHKNFNQFAWESVKMENLCGYAGPNLGEATPQKGEATPQNKEATTLISEPGLDIGETMLELGMEIAGGATAIQYTPTQDFIRNYFSPINPLKGMLLYHSVGTGKTCSAIAAATANFEPRGYTILWVTRTTLKNDIWKNMFEQVCNERIRQEIAQGIIVPEEQNKRMKMLSKSWSIRPMSYKQFSNLVSKKNDFYKALVKKNGDIDPLQKTLIIIDEAHKLYGKTDLSTIEKPDMDALYNSLMNSYVVSKENSVKLLLMTATPITEDPFELIKLLNLCKLPQDAIETNQQTFFDEYLDDHGHFTVSGERKYLDQIAGHISYLNRQNDARQFSQPIFKNVYVPLADDKTIKKAETYDTNLAKLHYNNQIANLQKKLMDNQTMLKEDLKGLNKARFGHFLKKCDKYTDDKTRKNCKKIVNDQVKLLLAETKKMASDIKNEIKPIRETLKNVRGEKLEKIKAIRDTVKENKNEYEKFMTSAYYTIRSKCQKKPKTPEDMIESMKAVPEVKALDDVIDLRKDSINALQQHRKAEMKMDKNRIKQIENKLSWDYNDLEKSVLRMVIADERKNLTKKNKQLNREMRLKIKDLNSSLIELNKQKKKEVSTVRSTLKKYLKKEEKETKKRDAETRKLQKLADKKAGIFEKFKEEKLINLEDQYNVLIDRDLEEIEASHAVKEKEKENKQREKSAKQEAKLAKEQEKAAKKAEKEQEKAAKKAEKEQDKAAKKAANTTRKLEAQEKKKAEKEAKNKTRKTKK